MLGGNYFQALNVYLWRPAVSSSYVDKDHILTTWSWSIKLKLPLIKRLGSTSSYKYKLQTSMQKETSYCTFVHLLVYTDSTGSALAGKGAAGSCHTPRQWPAPFKPASPQGPSPGTSHCDCHAQHSNQLHQDRWCKSKHAEQTQPFGHAPKSLLGFSSCTKLNLSKLWLDYVKSRLNASPFSVKSILEILF